MEKNLVRPLTNESNNPHQRDINPYSRGHSAAKQEHWSNHRRMEGSAAGSRVIPKKQDSNNTVSSFHRNRQSDEGSSNERTISRNNRHSFQLNSPSAFNKTKEPKMHRQRMTMTSDISFNFVHRNKMMVNNKAINEIEQQKKSNRVKRNINSGSHSNMNQRKIQEFNSSNRINEFKEATCNNSVNSGFDVSSPNITNHRNKTLGVKFKKFGKNQPLVNSHEMHKESSLSPGVSMKLANQNQQRVNTTKSSATRKRKKNLHESESMHVQNHPKLKFKEADDSNCHSGQVDELDETRKGMRNIFDKDYKKVESILASNRINYGYGDSKNRTKVLKFINEVKERHIEAKEHAVDSVKQRMAHIDSLINGLEDDYNHFSYEVGQCEDSLRTLKKDKDEESYNHLREFVQSYDEDQQMYQSPGEFNDYVNQIWKNHAEQEEIIEDNKKGKHTEVNMLLYDFNQKTLWIQNKAIFRIEALETALNEVKINKNIEINRLNLKIADLESQKIRETITDPDIVKILELDHELEVCIITDAHHLMTLMKNTIKSTHNHNMSLKSQVTS